MLKVDAIDSAYGETQVLFKVSLDVAAGRLSSAGRARIHVIG